MSGRGGEVAASMADYEARKGEMGKSEKLAFLAGWAAALDHAMKVMRGKKK